MEPSTSSSAPDASAEADSTALSSSTFSDLGLNDWLVKQCSAISMPVPTAIQYHCIPEILKGRDCMGCAKTGSGKTAAFALPILQKLCEDPYGIFTLVLAPTRELAFQIAGHFNVLGKPVGVKVCIVLGGQNMIHEALELSSQPHIVVATPGRLVDHILSGTDFSLKKIKFLVLDEADRLLEDGYGEQLKVIYDALPPRRQTLLFSATMTETLQEVNNISNNKPFCWFAKDAIATVDTLDQKYVMVALHMKDPYLVQIVNKFRNKHPNSSVMIFVQSCKLCQTLAMVFEEVGLQCVALHSVLLQRQRLAALTQFKSSQCKILISTDVGSRGLDIPTVDLVINHNVPNDPKNYVHRVGRTARAGRGGMAITLMTPHDVNLIYEVEKRIGTQLVEHKVNEQEVLRIALEVNVARREAELKLDEQDFGERKEINKQKRLILEGMDRDEIRKATAKRRRQIKREKESRNEPDKKSKKKQESQGHDKETKST